MRDIIVNSQSWTRWNQLTEAEKQEILAKNTNNYPKLMWNTTTDSWTFYKTI